MRSWTLPVKCDRIGDLPKGGEDWITYVTTAVQLRCCMRSANVLQEATIPRISNLGLRWRSKAERAAREWAGIDRILQALVDEVLVNCLGS